MTRARDHCLAPSRADAPLAGGRYGRMFPDLPVLDVDEGALHELGLIGGPCDAGPAPAEESAVAADVAAGWPFFGQFVAHDITADRSPVERRPDPGSHRNFRAPRADLECLYGGGPVGSPYLYSRADPAKLLLGGSGEMEDVPRNQEGIALVGDPRNDVHVFVSQLHVAMIKAHNLLVDRLREDGAPEALLFEEAQRATRWHYQFVLMRDFLPSLVRDDVLDDVLRCGPRYFRPGGEPFIPLEFADGAYRYGHSQIRHTYQLNCDTAPVPMFPDLMGFGPTPAARRVDWALMFDVPGRPPAQRSKRMDGTLPRSLIRLPTAVVGDTERQYHSLAVRDLQRGQAVGLPSGEQVAVRMGIEPLTEEEVGLRQHGWGRETPLWFYVLREALAREKGNRLGEVGGRIVAEVLVGLVTSDPESYLAVDSDWRPTLPGSSPDTFGLVDLLSASTAAEPRTHEEVPE